MPVFPQVISRRFWRRSLYVMLAMLISLLLVWGTPLTANGASKEITSVESAIEQGSNLFAAGQLAAAADVWQQAVQAYAAQENRVGKA
ncbi:MAG: hypothetical protein F6K11_17005, partial [Leptolyngbya sp. SIO3F4]|nr:hypothetical protein [Leptolyngbya sp. SIO3F4]